MTADLSANSRLVEHVARGNPGQGNPVLRDRRRALTLNTELNHSNTRSVQMGDSMGQHDLTKKSATELVRTLARDELRAIPTAAAAADALMHRLKVSPDIYAELEVFADSEAGQEALMFVLADALLQLEVGDRREALVADAEDTVQTQADPVTIMLVAAGILTLAMTDVEYDRDKGLRIHKRAIAAARAADLFKRIIPKVKLTLGGDDDNDVG